GCRLKAIPRSRSISELGRPATSIQVRPGVPRWKRHSSTSTPCSTSQSSLVYSTRVKSSASSGTGARPASVPGAVPGLVWRWRIPSIIPGRLEVGVGAGLDGQFGDDAEHVVPPLGPSGALLHKVLVFAVADQHAGLVVDGESQGHRARRPAGLQVTHLEHRIERVAAIDRL